MEGQINICSLERAETLVTSFSGDSSEQEQILYKCVDSIFEKKESEISGSADAFHNFAVSCIKIADDYLTAYDVIKLGLKLHPTNTDLLADAIKYGYNCTDIKKCEEYLRYLRTIDQRVWTWRAFSFTIDYLLDCYTSDNAEQNCISDVKELAEQYRKRYPHDEDSLYSKYEIHNRLGELTEAMDVLIEALESSDFCPKCWLKYADILVEEGKYTEATKPIIKLCRAPLTSDSVNWSYVNYLKGVCQMALLTSEGESLFDEQQYEEDKVNQIYMSFYKALISTDTYGNLLKRIKKRIKALQADTGIPLPSVLERVLKN